MVDVGQQPGVEVPTLSFAASRRARTWYNVWLAIFLLGPGLVALVVMGWLKAP